MAGALPPDPPAADASSVLRADLVLATVRRLRKRIEERFPDAGLNEVCAELERVCRASKARIDWIAQPIWPLRLLRYGLLCLILVALIAALVLGWDDLPQETENLSVFEVISLLEAGINDVILLSIAVFFVWTLEARIKRRRALAALHELRSIAHVIDMHQLPKDPDRLVSDRDDTESSPKSDFSAFKLRRYLDYCSEMLSLTGKVAALHLRELDDATVVAAVNEIETLTTGLSRKIWQKIDLVSRGDS